MIWRIAVALGLVLAACGESSSTELAADTEAKVSTVDDEGEAAAADAAVFQVDQECRNRGTVDGLESSWRVDGGYVPDSWRDRETVEGVLRHDQEGWATFTEDDGFAVIEVTDFGSFVGGCAEWASDGDEVAALFEVHEECSNGSEIADAFGVGWNLSRRPTPPDWRSRETVQGVLHFESFELSYFEADGYRLEMTTMGVDDSCEGWLESTELDFTSGSVECLVEHATLIDQEVVIHMGDGEGTAYDPTAIQVVVPAGSTLSVRSSDNDPVGDLDGDGSLDTVQFLDVFSPSEHLAEGIRVCKTSRSLKSFFVPSSNGNFGALVVPLPTSPAGITTGGGPVDGLTPNEVWLFDDAGYLIPPYGRSS